MAVRCKLTSYFLQCICLNRQCVSVCKRTHVSARNMACSRKAVLELYRNLIKESKKWCSYNYREYALRKIRHEFQQNKTLQDITQVENCYKKGLESLDVLKRQVIIGNLYKTDKLVIEVKQK